jgi:hypothetical protein
MIVKGTFVSDYRCIGYHRLRVSISEQYGINLLTWQVLWYYEMWCSSAMNIGQFVDFILVTMWIVANGRTDAYIHFIMHYVDEVHCQVRWFSDIQNDRKYTPCIDENTELESKTFRLFKPSDIWCRSSDDDVRLQSNRW